MSNEIQPNELQPDEPKQELKITNPIRSAADAPDVSGVAPFGRPPKEKKQKVEDVFDPSRPTRDKRWFLRIVAWIVLAVGTAIFLIGILPSDTSKNDPDAIMTSNQMMALAGIPFMLFGGFLVWWGYGKIGEPLVPCQKCAHINKPRSTVCKKCGETLG